MKSVRKEGEYRHHHDINNMRISEVMSHPVATVRMDTTLDEAAHRLVSEKISGLPVVNQHGKLAGIITEADFLCTMGIRCHHPTHTLWQTLELMLLNSAFTQDPDNPVSSLMARKVITVSPAQTLRDGLEVMKRNRIKRLIVCDEQRNIQGIVTRSDLIRTFYARIWGPATIFEG